MNVVGLVCRSAPVTLWGLDSMERTRRVLARVGVERIVDGPRDLDDTVSVLVLRGDHIYDERVLKGLLRSQGTGVRRSGGPDAPVVAAHVDAAAAAAIHEDLEHDRSPTAALQTLETPAELVSRVALSLRKAQSPFVLEVRPEHRRDLERVLYDAAYKGVTDLVTKFVWPRPARWGVAQCVRLGLTPNMVTGTGFILMLLALLAFWRGAFGWGLLAGWTMTWLDTVDGKLARTTLTSSRFGHYFDHGMDIVHPPFWYLAWGFGLGEAAFPIAGFDFATIMSLIFGGYIVGRLVEGVSSRLLVRGGLFVWRPYDSWFRLVTARRNPCLILMTAGWACGRLDLGLLGVALWTVLTSLLLLARMAMATFARWKASDLLTSWLHDVDPQRDGHRLSVRCFSQREPVLPGLAPKELPQQGDGMASGAAG